MPPRIAVVMEIPTPYRQPVFELLAPRGEVELHLFFLSRTQSDRHWNPEAFVRMPSVTFRGWQVCFKGYHTIHLNYGYRRELFDSHFDLYVINGYAQPALFDLLRHCWKQKRPYVMLTESHLQKPRRKWVRSMKETYVRRVYERSAANLVMGSASEAYVRHYGADPQKIFGFPNTIDGPSYGSRIDAHRGPVKSAGKNVLFVGTLNRRKGVDLLLGAFAGIASKYPDARLTFAGGGELEAALRKESVEGGLVDRVHFKGFVQPDDLPAAYAGADIFVLPSLEEPFGAVVCEAMAAGLPIIASEAVGAAADFVRNGENGFVVGTGDEPALARSLERLLADDRLRAQMGARSRARIAEWTHGRLAQNFLEAVRVALARSQGER